MLQTCYYRYHTSGQTNGYQHGLHYVFNAQSYARLTAALGTNLGSLTDAQVAPYADNAFQYVQSEARHPRSRARSRRLADRRRCNAQHRQTTGWCPPVR